MPRLTYNKKHGKRIARTKHEVLVHQDSHRPIFDEFSNLPERGVTLVQGYVEFSGNTGLAVRKGINLELCIHEVS